MALKATIFRADLSISDMGRNYYHDHSITIAAIHQRPTSA